MLTSTDRVLTSYPAMFSEQIHLHSPLLTLMNGGDLGTLFFLLICWVLEIVNKLKSTVLGSE